MQQSAGRQTAGIAAAEEAIEPAEARPRELPADKGRDADGLRAELPIRGVRPVIAWKSNRRAHGRLDQERHLPQLCPARHHPAMDAFRPHDLAVRNVSAMGHLAIIDAMERFGAAAAIRRHCPTTLRWWSLTPLTH